jgi:hypothetical protein
MDHRQRRSSSSWDRPTYGTDRKGFFRPTILEQCHVIPIGAVPSYTCKIFDPKSRLFLRNASQIRPRGFLTVHMLSSWSACGRGRDTESASLGGTRRVQILERHEGSWRGTQSAGRLSRDTKSPPKYWKATLVPQQGPEPARTSSTSPAPYTT